MKQSVISYVWVGVLWMCCAPLIPSAHGGGPAYTADEKVVVSFSLAEDAGLGREVFVTGNHPDIGSWNPFQARKLRWTDGNVWTGNVAIAAGNEIEYKYIIRTNTGAAFCAPENVTWMPGPNLTRHLPARSGAPFEGKTLYYYSAWTNAALLYRCDPDTNWHHAPMQRIGEGRHTGEYLYRASGIGKSGERVTFVPNGHHNGTHYWDNCPIEEHDNYFTRLDVFLLQDGHIYNYWPPANRTGSAIHPHTVTSSYTPQIPSRGIRVYTPRNYDQNTGKSYPVLYMHDGQNVFRPGGAFGCWYAEDVADNMISLGMMRETIIVAVDNTDKRLSEYLPPTDSHDGYAGTADKYLAFVVNDVMPFVNAHYRTLADPSNTGVIGSSFGGVASLYFGFASNVFGRIGPMSTSFWAIPNFVAGRIMEQDTSGLRIYTDFGTEESEGSFQGMWNACNKFMADGYVLNDTLRIEIGCGHPHSEWTWAARLPMALNFLFNARDEANLIAPRDYPPEVSIFSGAAGTVNLAFPALKGWMYVLQRTTTLMPPQWVNVVTGHIHDLMWDTVRLEDHPSDPGNLWFYRISGHAAPEE